MKFLLSFLLFVFTTNLLLGINDYDLALKKQNISDYDSSLYYFNTFLESKNLTDTAKALTLIHRGKSYQLAHKYELALIDFNMGIQLFKGKKNINGIALSHIFIAEFYRHLGKLKKAENEIHEAEQSINSFIIHPKTIALFYNRLASIYAETGSKGESGIIINSKKAIKISQKNGFKRIEASSFNQLGFLYFNKKDKRALSYYSRALTIYEDLNDLRAMIDVIKNIARYHQIAENFKDGIKTCNKGLDLIADKNWHFDLKDLYFLKMVSFYFMEDYEEAYETSRLYNEQYIKFMNQQNSKSLSELETKYNIKEKEKELIIEQKKAKLSKEETEQKKKEIKFYLIISILLVVILTIALVAYFKIKKTNTLLSNTVNQKDILLQEIHHRVKNNFQMISSLMMLQEKSITDKKAKSYFSETQSRIHSMAIIHQQLYEGDNLDSVNLFEFLNEILTSLATSDLRSQDFFSIKKSALSMHIEQAIPLGIIIHELATNSLKHAWETSHNQDKKIHVSFKQQEEAIFITYNDNGTGLPEGFKLINSNSFGLRLVDLFIYRQLKGNIKFGNDNGAFFTFNFKLRQ